MKLALGITSALITVLFCAFACQDHMVDSNGDCPSGQKLCDDGECHGCCADSDCSSGRVCCEDLLCSECCGHEDCHDELACNGQESCLNGSCVAGDPIDCDDGIACTRDTCEEPDGVCQSRVDHDLCPQGIRCRSDWGGCIPFDCDYDSECGTVVCCNDGQCHECCIDDQCLGRNPDCKEEYIICNDDYECECVCYREGESCWRDPEACCQGQSCDYLTNVCMPSCYSDADCHLREDVEYARDLKCQEDGACDFDHCNRDEDCPEGKVCYNADCVSPGGCSDISYCQISPETVTVRAGTTAQLSAAAYRQDDSLAPGAAFIWSSSAENIARIDATGLVTGGTRSGTATITATVAGCSISCQAVVNNY